MANKRKIILDCDPGIDDAVALCVAAAHPEAFKLLAISTVGGNQTIEKVTENALRLSAFYGLSVPVIKGAAGPILREPLTASDVHGKNGIGNLELPPSPVKAVEENAVVYLKNVIDRLEDGEKVTLVPIGPLTNIALLLKVFPEVKERIEEIVLMGGSLYGGNVTASAEFNIYEDPEAAAIVFDSGLPIVMCGLTATGKCGLDGETVQKLRNGKGKVAVAVGEMIRFYLDGPAYTGKPMASIHDASTFMYLLYPDIYKSEKMIVKVDCSEGFNRGMTVCDMRKEKYREEPTVTVLTDADGALFKQHLVESIQKLDRMLQDKS